MIRVLDPRIADFDPGRFVTPTRRPTVADLMDPAPVTLPPYAPALEAAHQLIARGVEEIVVVSGGRPLGVLTRSDLIRCRVTDLDAARSRDVDSLLPSRTRRLLPDLDIATAATVLVEEHVDAVPVVDSFGDLIGVLAARHIVGHVDEAAGPAT